MAHVHENLSKLCGMPRSLQADTATMTDYYIL
jgi:hypothetical protein